jgi:hypothetical protein
MGMGKGMSAQRQRPIWDSMMEAGIINQKMFTLCLGKNGGVFGIGGYNKDSHLEPVKWFAMAEAGANYKFKLSGISMNNHPLAGSNKWSVGFIDSGTTFSYVPYELWDSLVYHFDNYCNLTNPTKDPTSKYCPGQRFMMK